MTYNELLWKIEREKLKKPVLFLYESTYLHFTICSFLPPRVNVTCWVGFMTMLAFVFCTLYM